MLHIALQAHNSKHSCLAVELLVSKGLVQDGWNKEEKMAVDYLTGSNDKRAEILMDFYIKDMKELSEEELKAAMDRRDKWLEEKALEKVSEEHGEDQNDTGKSGKKLEASEPSKQGCPGSAEAAEVLSKQLPDEVK